MKNLKEAAQDLLPQLVALRRQLHQCPELGSELTHTRTIVREYLQALGLSVQECAGGLIAEIAGGAGPVVLLRADMDALPMAEQSGLPFAATGPAAHTCGHDMHTAMLLGAAHLLCQTRQDLRGTVRLLFQPDEETAQGARAMLQAGAGENVNAAMGLHVAPGQPVGLLNCTVGEKTASYDRFVLTVKGIGGHGAMPHLAADPIQVGARICLACQELISAECAPGSSAVITVGSFHAGNSANSIPESASLEGTIRAAQEADRQYLCRRLKEIAEGIAGTFRTEAKLELVSGVPVLYNDPSICDRLSNALREALGGEMVDCTVQRLSASEDFALFAQQIPSVYLTIGTGEAKDGYIYGNHHPAVRYHEDALAVGAAAYAVCAHTLLGISQHY